MKPINVPYGGGMCKREDLTKPGGPTGTVRAPCLHGRRWSASPARNSRQTVGLHIRGAFPFLRINERVPVARIGRKPPRSGVTRITGGVAQRNPRPQAETKNSRVAASQSRALGGRNAATRHGPHDFDSGGSAALHPRLFTSCRSAAHVAMVTDAITGMHPTYLPPVAFAAAAVYDRLPRFPEHG